VSLPLEPSQVHDLLNAMERARHLHGEDPPTAELARDVINHAASTGLRVSFHHVLSDEGEMVWEVRMDTGRGVLKRQCEEDETWTDVFESMGILPPDTA
jgi:hypothetical protein